MIENATSAMNGNSRPLATLALRALCALALALTLSACEIEGESLSGGPDVANDGGGGGDGGGGNGGDGGGGDGGGGGGDGGGGDGGGGGDPMPPPVDPDPPQTPPPPTDQAIFEATLYPLLTEPANFCVGCHGANQIPQFAVADPTAAYNVVIGQQRVNLMAPEQSRIYLRPAVDRHNCGGVAECDRIGAEFLAAIQSWSDQAIMNVPPPDPNGSVVLSAKTNFAEGLDGGIARADDNVIAKFEFAEGTGDTTTDTSGVGTPIVLQLQGMEWVDGGGLRNVSGKAQASLADSQRLFDMITPNDEYTVEAWVIPENTAQDGPARIVSYSQDTATRNFTMGQNAIYYVLRNRTPATGANGTPQLEALDPQVETRLQHVVMTFDAASGRKIYIDGALSIEENTPDTLDWQNDQILVLGNEVTDNRLWRGVFQFVAIHNRALSSAQVQQNFDAGVSDFLTLRFDVAAIVGAPAHIEVQAAQLDEVSYVFATPALVTDAGSVAVKNIRIAVNDTVPVAAQSFRRIDTVALQPGRTELSPLAAVIPTQFGAELDQFHLEFELLGTRMGVIEAIAPATPPVPLPDEPEPEYGVRTFSQVLDTMSALTGVAQSQNAVRTSYAELRDSLPATPDLLAFGPAQQIAIQRLAKTYCGVIVNDATRCNDLFGACEIAGGGKQQVADALYQRFIGANLAEQPDAAAVSTEIVRMIDDLGCTNGCNGAAGETVLQATCTAVLSSAAITVN